MFRKKYCILFFITFISVASAAFADTIYSTVTGGYWDDVNTWVGTTIPSGADDVILVGPVSTANHACNNLTIESGGSLENQSNSARNHYINGNVVNNGAITDAYVNYLVLYISGNITNNGTWDNKTINLNGTTDQYISISQEFAVDYFNDNNNSGDVIASTDLTFNNTDIDFNDHTLDLSGSSDLYLTNNCELYEVNILANGNTINMDGIGYIQYADITNCSLSGTVVFANAVDLYGTIINNGILENHSYSSRDLDVIGDFTNNGTVRNSLSVNELHLWITGNLTNNGTLINRRLHFNGTTDQNLSFTSECAIDFIYCDNTDGDRDRDIYALTDVTFNGSEFDFNDHSFVLSGSNDMYLTNDFFIDEMDIQANGNTITCSESGTLQYSSITDFTLEGTYIIAANVEFYGTVINNATIQNHPYSDRYLDIHGPFTNNGTIKDDPTTNSLTLYLYDNFINNGTLLNKRIQVKSTDQHISATSGNSFEITYFDGNSSRGNIYFDSDIEFISTTVDLRDDNLILQSGTTMSLDASSCKDGTIDANDATIEMTNDGCFVDIAITDVVLDGITQIGDGNVDLNNTVINNGILQNKDNNSHALDVNGDIINNGTIRNNPTQNMLNLDITGNIENYGTWENRYIYLVGTSEQHIICGSTNTFSIQGLYGNTTRASIYFDSDIEFVNTTIDLNDDTLILELTDTLTLNGCSVTDGFIQANNATVNMTNDSYFTYITIEDAIFDGVCNIANGYVDFDGNTIIQGILQNFGNNLTLNVDGDITNNGTIRNNPTNYVLYINAYGNVTNNGVWENERIEVDGTSDQTITLVNDQQITAQTRFRSDIEVSPYQWKYNDVAIPGTNPDFSGETTAILTWIAPVSSSYYGTFICSTGGGLSRNIIVAGQGSGLNPPENVVVSINGSNVEITWDAVSGATSYKVYSSDDTLSGFVEDTTGTFNNNSWSAPVLGSKKFYYVTASTTME